MAKYYPTSDVTDGNWTTQAGGTDLASVLDETTRDDGDYIQSGENPVNDACEVHIGNPAGLLESGVLKFAIGKKNNNSVIISIIVALMQGTTEIARWTYENVAYGFELKTETLTTAQRAALNAGDLSDIRVRITGTTGMLDPLKLDLNFVEMTELDSRITFSRASTAMMFDSEGMLVYAPYNFQTYSDMNSTGWVAGGDTTFTPYVVDGPFEGSLAASIFSNATPSTSIRAINSNAVAATGVAGNKTVSVYMKAGPNFTNGHIQCNIDGASQGAFFTGFNLLAGTVGGTADIVGGCTDKSASIEHVGGGWYRCSVTFSTAGTNVSVYLGPSNNSSTRDSTSATAGNGIYVYGVQVNTGRMLLPYAHNPTASVYYGPRLDYDPTTGLPLGLLLEEQRTNYCLYSEQLDNAEYTKQGITVTANSIAAPDGTTTADLLTNTNGTGINKRLYQILTVSAGQKMTFSSFVKKGTSNFCYLQLELNGASSTGYFNLNTGAWGTLPADVTNQFVETLPNGWYRIGFSRTANTGASQNHVFLGMCDADNDTTSTDTSTLYAWGLQAELGAFATSYIPTTSASVTRARDSATMTGTNFSGWWNATEGTFVAEGSLYSVVNAIQLLRAHQAAAASNERIFMSVTAATGAATDFVIDDGVSQVSYGAIVGTHVGGSVAFKRAQAFKANDFAGCLNGGTVQTDTSGTLPTCDTLLIGEDSIGASMWNGHISRIRFYNVRKTNVELQELTDQTLDINFVLMRGLDKRITYSRSSDGTYFDSNGVMRTAAAGKPRFDHDPASLEPRGLLLEEQRTNLCRYSEEFNNGAWGGAGPPTANTTVSPNGTQNADTLAGYIQISATAGSSGVPHTWSIFAKAGTASKLWVDAYDGTTHYSWFDLANGTTLTNSTGNTSTIQSIGNGWYRCTVTRTIGSTALLFDVGPASADTVSDPSGAGTTYVYGAQLEAGAFATSYIPTTSASVTRAADSASMTGTNFSDWYNASAGTFVLECGIRGNGHYLNVHQAAAGTGNRIVIFDGTPADPYMHVDNGAVNQVSTDIGGNTLDGATAKMAIAFSANDFAGCTDGGAVATDTSGTLPTVDRLYLFLREDGLARATGWVSRLRFYPTRKTNAELQALTDPDPILDLNFVLMSELDRRITFSRTSHAMQFNEGGVLVYAPHNLTSYSDALYMWSQQQSSLTANDAEGPLDGKNTAGKLTSAGTSDARLVNNWATLPAGAHAKIISCYLKAGTSTWGYVRNQDQNSGLTPTAWFNLAIGAVGSISQADGASIEYVGNGWYRCSVYGGGGGGNQYMMVGLSDADNSVAVTNGRYLWMWGPQVNEGRRVTDYVKTETSAVYGPRLAYDPDTLDPSGLLLEEQRTNLELYSGAIDNAVWAGYTDNTGTSSRVGASGIVPDGTNTATLVTVNRSSAGHWAQGFSQNFTGTVATYTGSVWLKAYAAGDVGKVIDLTIYNPASVVVSGNTQVTLTADWVRYTVSGTMAAVTNCGFFCGHTASGISIPNTASTTGEVKFLAWGAQVELGSFATSYIPTTTAAVTRAADSATMTGANFSSWFNNTEGTFVLAWTPMVTTASDHENSLSAHDGTANERIIIGTGAGNTNVSATIVDGGSVVMDAQAGTRVAMVQEKIAFAFKLNDCAASNDGAAVVTDTSVTIPTVNALQIGASFGPGYFSSGWYGRLRFYRTRRTNAQLQELTT